MRIKIIALALGLLLAVLPGAALAQMNTGGTQTFTVPQLTVTPGGLTVAGTTTFSGGFTITGDFELGGDLIFEGATPDAFETTLTVEDPTTPDKTITLPNLTGTVLLGGATNTLGAVTTTINSGTQFNIHSDANVTIDGDADNAGGGTVTLTADNDANQLLLTNTGITANTEAAIGFTVNTAGGTDAVFQVQDIGGGTVNLSLENTTASTIQVGDSLNITADGAALGAGNDLTLAGDDVVVNGAALVDLNATTAFTADGATAFITGGSVGDGGYLSLGLDTAYLNAANSGTGAEATLDIDVSFPWSLRTLTDGTDSAALNMDSASSILIDADVDDDGDGSIDLTVDNSQTALNLAVDAATLTTSDGTDTADVRMGPTSVTIDGDVDDDVDGTVTLTAANSTSQVVVNSTGVAITSAGSEQHIQSGFTSYRYQDTKVFVDETALDLVKLAFADEGHAAGTFKYVATMANGTNVQAVSGSATYACINQGDTEVCDIDMLAAESTAVDGGTLACVISIDVDEANAVMFVATCDSEADDAGGTFNWIMENMTSGVTATLQ